MALALQHTTIESHDAHSIADFSKAIRNSVQRTPPKSFRDYYFRGAGYFKTENYDRAISDFNQALQLKSESFICLLPAGEFVPHQGKVRSRPRRFHTDDRSRSQRCTCNHSSRAIVYQEKGDYDKAIADYTEAIQRPDLAEAYLGRGIANLYAGSPAKALADVNQATALDPKNMTAALWRDILSKRNNVPSRLPKSLSQLDIDLSWPAPVLWHVSWPTHARCRPGCR